jgi:hypothetical protein
MPMALAICFIDLTTTSWSKCAIGIYQSATPCTVATANIPPNAQDVPPKAKPKTISTNAERRLDLPGVSSSYHPCEYNSPN